MQGLVESDGCSGHGMTHGIGHFNGNGGKVLAAGDDLAEAAPRRELGGFDVHGKDGEGRAIRGCDDTGVEGCGVSGAHGPGSDGLRGDAVGGAERGAGGTLSSPADVVQVTDCPAAGTPLSNTRARGLHAIVAPIAR